MNTIPTIEEIEQVERSFRKIHGPTWNGKISFEPTALIIEGPLTWFEFLDLGGSFAIMKRALHFWIGDWFVYGFDYWGEKAAQAIDPEIWTDGGSGETFGYSMKTIQNDIFVCRNVAPSRRREELTFGHHSEIAAMDPDDQVDLLDRAVRRGWTVRKIRRARDKLRGLRGERTGIQKGIKNSDIGDRRFRRLARLIRLFFALDQAIADLHYPGDLRGSLSETGDLAYKRRSQIERIRGHIWEVIEGEGK